MIAHSSAYYSANMQEDWSLIYVRHILAKLGIAPSALAELAGVSSTTLTRPLNSDDYSYRISPRTLDKIQDATGIPYAGFTSGTHQASQDDTIQRSDVLAALPMAMVNVFNVQASAGHGSTVSEEMVVERLSFPMNYLETITRTAPSHLAIIGVRGDSMLPTLKHEDAVMIDTTKKSLGFDGLFVLRFDGELHVKRVGRASEPGRVSIISDNRNEFPLFERRIEDVEVVGKVVWMGKKV